MPAPNQRAGANQRKREKMKFEEMAERVKLMYPNEYFSLRYEANWPRGEKLEAVVATATVVVGESGVHKVISFQGATWKEVLEKFQINLIPKAIPDIEEAPAESEEGQAQLTTNPMPVHSQNEI
jgi:hypothetical protein